MKKMNAFILIILLCITSFSFGQSPIVAIDQYPPSMCENAFGSSRVLGIDMTVLESSIYNGTGVTYTWYSNQSCTNLVINPSNNTIYMGDVFYVVVTDGTSSDTASVTYTIYEIPYFWNHSPDPLCEDNPGSGVAGNVDLTTHQPHINGCSTTQFTWYLDAAFSNPVSNPNNVSVYNGQTFYLDLYNTLYLCSNSTSITFTVKSKPIASNIDTNICLDINGSHTSSFDLTSFNSQITGGTTNSVKWYSNSSHTSLIETPVNLTLSNTKTKFYAVITNGFCQNYSELTIGVFPNPKADFIIESNSTSLLEPNFKFTNQSISYTTSPTLLYSWHFAENEFSTDINPEYTFIADAIGNFDVALTVKDINGCLTTTTKTATITEAHNVYIPNAFSPNGDGVNDYFTPSGFGISEENYSMRVFNRSGVILFESRDINKSSWDGNYNGKTVPSGTYILKIVFDDLNGIKHEKISTISVL